jgi:nickel transport protein
MYDKNPILSAESCSRKRGAPLIRHTTEFSRQSGSASGNGLGMIGYSRLATIVTAVAMILMFGSTAWSHKVKVFAYVEGDLIVVEGYFSGKAKAKDCVVEVLDANGKVIHQGKTNKDGIYSFKAAELPLLKEDIQFVLRAGSGHEARYSLAREELPGSVKSTDGPSQQAQDPRPSGTAETDPEPAKAKKAVAAAVQADHDPDLMRKTMEQVLDSKIEPLVRMLGKQQRMLLEQQDKGPSLSDVIGGIGWVFGLFGVAAYVMSRKRDS